MDGFMRARTTISCPVCGSVLQATLDDVRLERTVQCPNGHHVRLVDQGNGAQRLDRELHKLDQTMRRAGIKVKWRRQ